MFRVLVFFSDNEKQVDYNGDEFYKEGYIFRDVNTEEEMVELFNACSKALIDKVNEHYESYGKVEVLKGTEEDFDCEKEAPYRVLKYSNICSEEIEVDTMKSVIDVWDEVVKEGCKSKTKDTAGMVNEIMFM